MQNDLITALDALRRNREAKEREFNQELARLDRLILEMETMIRQQDPNALPATTTEYTGLSISDAAVRYLESIKRPAAAREISAELRKRGVVSAAKNFDQVVYMALRTNKRLFQQTQDRRWTLKSPDKPAPKGEKALAAGVGMKKSA